ncbi:MAG: hypothetical protein JWO16_1233 [Sphingomonas bacterium]|nr:hypothetical protein [Sphingomonas bacterium]
MDQPLKTSGATRFARVRAALEARQPRTGWRLWVYEFLLFGFKQGWACLFGALMLALLLGTHFLYPEHAPLARNDFLTIMAVLIQAGMLAFRLESWEEAKVILAFHVTGTIMEQFKTQAGSWNYTDGGVLHIGMVPLYSGFMYAAVGSYIARVWRIFEIHMTHWPSRWQLVTLAIAIYINFFAHHWLPDIRLLLFVAIAAMFWRSRFFFTPFRTERWMPVLLGFLLVALFIWFAENIGTFANAWSYPNQRHGWQLVGPAKLGAWYLLMIISVVMVSLIHEAEAPGGKVLPPH